MGQDRIKAHLVNACRLKVQLNPELEHTLNHTAQVMAKHFTQRLIDLRRVALTADMTAELCLDHAKGRFRV